MFRTLRADLLSYYVFTARYLAELAVLSYPREQSDCMASPAITLRISGSPWYLTTARKSDRHILGFI